MVVDDVEVAGPLVAVEDVAQLPEGAADPLTRGDRVHGRELRDGVRIARSEQRDVVPAVDQPVREQRDDPLDAAVAGGRHGEPTRGDDGNFHAGSTLTRPSLSLTSHVVSKA